MVNNFHFDEKQIQFIQRNFTNNFKFKLVMFKTVPMGYLSGMRIKELTNEKCVVTVPYKRLNKNPFHYTYWAVLGMAAEMSCGAMVAMYTFKQKTSIATLIVSCSGEFVKKATDVTIFVCNDGLKIEEAILKTIEAKEPQIIECSMTGKNKSGEDVAHFTFSWSVKVRSE
jgi:hypothetical protein